MAKVVSLTNNTCVNERDKRKHIQLGQLEWKKQWRWRCQFRDAYYVCKLIWPFAHVKLPGVQKIIEHYSKEILMNDKVVDLKKYKEIMSLE